MSSEFGKMSGVIVGLGSIGNRHLNNMLDLGVGNMSVVRRKESQNTQFQPAENVRVFYSLEDALQASPEFVVVCNPTYLHVETALAALDADCHVLIEKPLCKSMDDDAVRELISKTESNHRVCAMAYCMRYHPAYRLAKAQIGAGVIGRCRYAKAWFEGYLPDWHPWEDYTQSYAAQPEQGGGVLRTLDHELDFLNWVLGPATNASGVAINTGSIGIEADDLAMYSLQHPGGVASQVTASFCRKPQSRGFEFVGEDGVLSFSMESAQVKLQTSDGAKTETVLELGEYDINQMYVELADAFCRSLSSVNGSTSGRPPGLDSALNCMRLIELVSQNSHVIAGGR